MWVCPRSSGPPLISASKGEAAPAVKSPRASPAAPNIPLQACRKLWLSYERFQVCLESSYFLDYCLNKGTVVTACTELSTKSYFSFTWVCTWIFLLCCFVTHLGLMMMLTMNLSPFIQEFFLCSFLSAFAELWDWNLNYFNAFYNPCKYELYFLIIFSSI